jgi:hypothetical protein
MENEVNSLKKNDTWEIIDQPTRKSPITAKWIYKIKRDAQGEIAKLKARLVARGFQQIEGIDFLEISHLLYNGQQYEPY